MVDFKFYLNRQGVRGQRGEKGDTGFSPIITEKTNTKEEYVLHIQNETDDTSFDTPNLKEGLVPEDMGGTYVRLNRETGNQYYGDIDEATETIKGVVRLEPDATILEPTSETSVITAEQALHNYTKKTETQDLQNAVTANSGDIDKLQDMEYVSSVGVYGSDLTVQKSKNGVITTNATIPLPTGTGDVPIATITTAGKVKPDGTTITITDDGTISAVGGGSAPTNMVTTDTEQEISGQKTFTYLGSSFDGNIYPSLKINQLTIGQTPAITPVSAFQSSPGLDFYVNNSNKHLSMRADGASNTFILGTSANNLTIMSDGKIVLKAGTQGTLTINNGVKFKDYYQNEYDLLNATPAVIDGGDSTSV